jgi:CRISPR system Cascade subunit CasC
MNKMVEVHKLQQLGISSPNRGQDGLTKSVLFGNAVRARMSSQSQNYAIRQYIKDEQLVPDKNLDIRTREFIKLIGKKLVQDNVCNDEQAKKVVEAVTTIFGYKTKNGHTDCLLFISKAGIDALYNLCSENCKDLLTFFEQSKIEDANKKEEAKKSGQSLKKSKPDKNNPVVKKILALKDKVMAIDDALCIGQHGRMVAHDPNFSVESSVCTAHAFSTHKSGVEFDFFSAVDDVVTANEDDSGAGMMGDASYNAPCYYAYFNDNYDNLKQNLNGNAELAQLGLKCWVDAFVKSSPSGKIHSFAHFSLPEFVLVTVRAKGQPFSLATAFTKAVTASDHQNITEESAMALVSQWYKLDKMYDLSSELEGVYYISAFDLENVPPTWKRMASFKELMTALENHFKE